VKSKRVKTRMLASSNWNNTSNAGLCYLNSNNVASNSNRNIGCRLELRMLRGEGIL